MRHSSFCGAFSVIMFSVGLFPVPLVRYDFLEGAPLLLPSTPPPKPRGGAAMKLYKYTTADDCLAAIRVIRLKLSTLADVNDLNEWFPVLLIP